MCGPILVALQLLDWESDLLEVFLKKDEIQVVDRLPEHGRVWRLHGTHGLINEIDLLFEQITPAIDEWADVLAELDRGKDLRLGSRKL